MMSLRKRKCPSCHKKGLHYADHPHAYGWKNYDIIECRFCHKRFKTDKLEEFFSKEALAEV